MQFNESYHVATMSQTQPGSIRTIENLHGECHLSGPVNAHGESPYQALSAVVLEGMVPRVFPPAPIFNIKG